MTHLALDLGQPCTQPGGCGCAHLLDCDAREGARDLATHLVPRVGELRAAWCALLPESAEGERLAWAEAELGALFEALAAADGALASSCLLRGAQDVRLRGASIHAAALSAQLLWDCVEGVARDGLGRDALGAQVLGALRRLRGLHAALVGLAYGAAVGGAGRPALSVESAPTSVGRYGLIGVSQVMLRLMGRIELAARGRETVLIAGESGVGKELVARAIHRASGDPEDRFIAVNCAAIPATLVESELFGHRRGAFSGAATEHLGLVRAAEGGTLFLDEISELEPLAQAKLLRVIQERSVRPVGAIQESPVRVRIVAATNRVLREATHSGALRRDLYYRLQRLVVEVPPLRDRLSDLPLLVSTFVDRWSVAYEGASPKVFSPAAIEQLLLHSWPGNVRELENVVFAACLASAGRIVELHDLPALGLGEDGPARAKLGPAGPLSMREAERAAIVLALASAGGNKSEAARCLGISRKQLYAKIAAYGIE